MLDDVGLIARHVAGEPRAFKELMRTYERPVYGYLVRCGVPPATRDDLFQEIFLRIHKGAKSYTPGRALKPWVFTIVANTVRSHFRKKRAEVSDDATLERAPDTGPSSVQIAEAKETLAFVEEGIAKLPLQQREVLVLVTIEKMTMQDAAEALEIPINTVKTNLRRARMSLAEQLARRNKRLEREAAR